MTPVQTLPVPATAGALCCGLAGYAAVRAAPEELAVLRKQPLQGGGDTPPASLFRHADDQTVAGLSAVGRAMRAHALEGVPFAGWGVIAAPRFLGRVHFGSALQRWGEEGAWGISPHLIPHRSLHSISGLVSQVLQLHGPNFGVGGGPGAAAEAIVVAGGLLARGQPPGLWVVLTGYSPEPVPEEPFAAAPQAPRPTPICLAVALALVPPQRGWDGPWLQIGMTTGPGPNCPPFELEHLVQPLSENACCRRQRWRLACGGWVELSPAGAGTESGL